MINKSLADLVELKEIRSSIDSIIDDCATGEIDREQMLAQIWMQFVFLDLKPEIMH